MNIIEKIEHFINTALIKCWAFLCQYLIPKPIKKSYQNFVLNYKSFKKRYKTKIKVRFIKFLQTVKYYNQQFFVKAENAKNFPYQDYYTDKKNNFTIKYKSRSIKEHIKAALIYLYQSMTFKRKPDYSKLAALFIIMTLSYGIYESAHSIYKKETTFRAPASVVQKIYRPQYASFKERTLKVQNINIPLIVNNKKEIHSIVVDFSIRTDTVFAKIFLDNMQYKIKDRFYTTTYRLPSSFPLEQEGKKVLKEKVIRELNLLLKENKVEGEVKELNFAYNVAN